MMTDKNNYIYDLKKKNDFSDYQFTSSWENNYKSWKDNQLLPVKFIKYEDLLKETFSVFKEIIEFIKSYQTIKKDLIEKKAKNAVSSTSFDNLKKIEEKKVLMSQLLLVKTKKKDTFFSFRTKK